ncbi:hypothetical protein AAG565_13270 [Fontimonas sp. SYSU GA230001]|uniref:hypothetical protein n=1 Tax=Fontimonas sp. SYSU GA230001 TaxID=3142450 RepID=UPI0032B3F635
MNKHVALVMAGLWAGVVSQAVQAGGEGARPDPERPALAQAIERVRAEQRVEVQQAARDALAQLRSETASAVAQGAAPAASGGIKAAH